ncbi:unnamed protein product [Ambrosiozyma monospora]|uniref:Unnamed protein product n=1 Tax=Ambrosiozyma monospora TaxID=43982 RepID=A0A9W6YRY5_AMBMO|nr:unnamed protein product [Ambrosiozyma monospora]
MAGVAYFPSPSLVCFVLSRFFQFLLIPEYPSQPYKLHLIQESRKQLAYSQQAHHEQQLSSPLPLASKTTSTTTISLPPMTSPERQRPDVQKHQLQQQYSEQQLDQDQLEQQQLEEQMMQQQQNPRMTSQLRHNFPNNETYFEQIESHYFNHWDSKRNLQSGNPKPEDESYKIPDWKSQPDKKKTQVGALVMCLNLGIPPPDAPMSVAFPTEEAHVKTNEFFLPTDGKKVLQMIGKNMQGFYELISPRTKCKQSLDPSVEDLKRLCTSLRRNNRDDRILFHYNGHGVPQPTPSGELWVFNRTYTQYIPISLYDLQNWIGAPCIFVIDTSAAGNVIENNKRFVQKRIDDEANSCADPNAPSPVSSYLESFQFAACRSDETLPLNPDLPADMFTSCLLTPIDMSLKWFLLTSPLNKNGEYDVLKNKEGDIVIPGKTSERKSPLGELSWILIAVTDSIAWNTISRPLFKKLFRQDLMVAALFRNFLLARRIMQKMGVHPMSDPPLADVSDHPMWDSWDLAIEEVLTQMLRKRKEHPEPEPDPVEQMMKQPDGPLPQQQQQTQQNGHKNSHPQNRQQQQRALQQRHPNGQLVPARPPPQPNALIDRSLSFYEQHLTAFDKWLQFRGSTKEVPTQLPILLQVLLSQLYRLRALSLLSRFLDLGPWAVHLALSVGIFPYTLKLLQSLSPELKHALTFIWARLMAVEHKNAQQELCKDRRYNYFVLLLMNKARPPFSTAGFRDRTAEVNFGEQKAMCAFILCMFMNEYTPGQKLCFSIDLINICFFYIETSDSALLRQWCAFLISQLLRNNLQGILEFSRHNLTTRILQIDDNIPEVGASIVHLLSSLLYIGGAGAGDEGDIDEADPVYAGSKEELTQQDVRLASHVLTLRDDGALIIRREAVCFYSRFVVKYLNFFLVCAYSQLEEEVMSVDNPSAIDKVRRKSPTYCTVFSSIWRTLLILTEDPHDEVQNYAEKIVDYVMLKLHDSPLGDAVTAMEDHLVQKRSGGPSTANGIDRDDLYGGMKPEGPVVNGEVKTIPKRRLHSMNYPPPQTKSRQKHLRSVSSASNMSSLSATHRLLSKLSISNLLNTIGIPEGYNGDDNISDSKFSLLSSHAASVNAPKPKTPLFMPAPTESGKPILPLKSHFFECCCEYFKEPQILQSDSEEEGSEEDIKRVWRTNRNIAIIKETQSQKELALTGNWRNIVATFDNNTRPRLLQFTQFENWIVSTDERDSVTVFDWKNNCQLSRFSNGNPFGTRVTDMKFVNEDDSPLLLTGSSDGVIRIFKNFDDVDEAQLISSWRALPDIMPTSRSRGVITDWQQTTGSLLVTGDIKSIRVWNASFEKCVSDISVRSPYQITCLTSDQVSGNIIVGGFQDGTIRVYDKRINGSDRVTRVWKPQELSDRAAINNVHMQRGGLRELLSASSNGLVQLWDIRMEQPLLKYKAFKNMTTALIHEHAPLIACASNAIDFYKTNGEMVCSVPGKGEGYVNSIALHPHRMMMAANHNFSKTINVYQCTNSAYVEDALLI